VSNSLRAGSRTASEEALARSLAPRITERDRAICRVLYEHRVLAAGQLHELYFDSIERARKRLAQLYELRVLERFRPYRQRGSHPYHYLLDRNGAQLIASERGIDAGDLDWSQARTLRLASSQQLRHQVETNGLVTRLAQDLRATPGAALVEWRGQRRCAQAWGELVRPDSYVRLALPAGEVEVWLEHDRATEPHARLQDKLDRYEEFALALERPITLLLSVPSERRERAVHRALRPAGDVLLLTGTSCRHHEDPLGSNWLAPGADRRTTLAELATSTCATAPIQSPSSTSSGSANAESRWR
jgi:hypothetical protein